MFNPYSTHVQLETNSINSKYIHSKTNVYDASVWTLLLDPGGWPLPYALTVNLQEAIISLKFSTIKEKRGKKKTFDP